MTRHTQDELDYAALLDLVSDAVGAEAQAKDGPFYPEKGITAESLAAYAVKCRDKAARYSAGGAHHAALKL
jgi:hypothetical protein